MPQVTSTDVDWKTVKKASGYTHCGHCEKCRCDGILMRHMYQSGIYHAHFICPSCNRKLSESVSREELRRHSITIESLPIYEMSEYVPPPPCLDCGQQPQVGRVKEFGKWIPRYFCRYCSEVFGEVDEKQLMRMRITLMELPDVAYLELRSLPYNEYLQTPHWRRVRESMKWWAGEKCQMCGKPEDLNVHHNNYKRLGQERPEDLIVLCRACHEIFHEKQAEERA